MLYFGAEGLVSGSSSIAVRVGITPLVVGLTIVAFGTSSPELVVSIAASLQEKSEIVLGNVIGSNICNIALIVGVAAMIRPIRVDIKLIKTDIWIMIGISLLLIIILFDGMINFYDGLILFAGILIYNYATIYMAKTFGPPDEKSTTSYNTEIKKPERKTWLDVLFIIGGIVVLVVGANLFLQGAIDIASFLGASEALIGLSIVAFGTSLPELATSVVAAIKNEGDISIGNAIGSNIFNILFILGAAALISPISGENIEWIDLGMMMFVAIIIFPLAWTKFKLTRPEGAFLLIIYVSYIYYLFQQLPAK